MKKILLACIFAFITSVTVYADNISEKVLQTFQAAFPDVKETKWFTFETYYEVYFKNETKGTSCKIDYNFDGTILSTRRYYEGSELSPFIKAKVNEKYSGKKIFGITEVTSSDEFAYHIVLEDEKNFYNIKSDAYGNIELETKFRKATAE